MPKKTKQAPVGFVYLLHFEIPYISQTLKRVKWAQHYIGWSKDPEARLQAHLNGGGCPLVLAAHEAGCGVTIARTWPNVTREFERKLKNARHHRRFCPLCDKDGNGGKTTR